MAKEPKPLKCRVCGGPSRPWLRPAVEGTTFKAKWIESNVCSACEKADEAKRTEEENKRATAEALKRAGMGDAYYSGVAFGGYRTDTPARERVARMVRPLYKRLLATGTMGNLLMTGNAGAGKTHLAASFAKEALKLKRRVFFTPVSELLLRLRQSSLAGKQMNEYEILANNDVLVLDDLGAEKATEFVAETLYMIVDLWYRRGKQGLIVTSNMTLGRLGEVYGDRLVSRLAGMCAEGGAIVDFDGCPDGRIEKLQLGDKE